MPSQSMGNDIERLYGITPDLLDRIRPAIAEHPQPESLRSLFVDIANHFEGAELEVSASKRRKGNHGSHIPAIANGHADAESTVILTIKDVSFSMPQRKKMHLSIIHHGDPSMIQHEDPYTRSAVSNAFALGISDPKTGKSEMEASLSDFAHVLCLPVPEKPQRMFNYCFIPKPNTSQDSIVFTVPASWLKEYTSPRKPDPSPDMPIAKTPLTDILDDMFATYGLNFAKPGVDQFVSAIPEVQRKNEKAYHVKAHIGTKDGYMFFLSTGIFFGFKKPLKFIPLEAIESTSFVRPVSRTFGLAIAYREEGKEETDEVEFDQIDNQEHSGINEYIQRHGIQDGSFAENRKAKIAKKEKGGEAEAANSDDDGRTELEKAEQQIQDEEDEEEEDYDPDVEESGSENDSEDDDYANSKAIDLVGEELGSEAEDVSDEDEDEDEDAEDAELDEGEEEDEDEEEHKPVVDRKVLPQRPPEPSTLPPKVRRAGQPDPEDDDQL